MLRFLVPLFIFLPLFDFMLLVSVGSHIGFWPTVALVILTGTIGAFLAKQEGRRVLGQWHEAQAALQAPKDGLISGALLLMGGVFLLSPGLITDAIGFFLLIPFTRRHVATFVKGRVDRAIDKGVMQVKVGGSVGGRGAPFGEQLRREGMRQKREWKKQTEKKARMRHNPFDPRQKRTRPRPSHRVIVDVDGKEL